MTAPLANQDKDAIALDPNFSTTRLVTREKPVIVNDPSSKVQSTLFLPPNPERKGEGGLRTKGYFKRSYDEASGLSENLPLVTVITVVFNGEKYLEQTIQSVINQSYDNVEYIVIDGGSTDGTVDIIRKYEEKIDYWVSEPDEGIADAMNKGIRLSSGILINHLHVGDLFDNKRVIYQIALSYFEEKWRWCYGKRKTIDSSGQLLNLLEPPKFSKRLLYLTNFIPHDTVFSEKELFKEAGVFDKKYQCGMDYHLWLRYSSLCQPKQFNTIISRYLTGGKSSDQKLALTDEIKARMDVIKPSLFVLLLDVILLPIKYAKRKLNITTFVQKNSDNE